MILGKEMHAFIAARESEKKEKTNKNSWNRCRNENKQTNESQTIQRQNKQTNADKKGHKTGQ